MTDSDQGGGLFAPVPGGGADTPAAPPYQQPTQWAAPPTAWAPAPPRKRKVWPWVVGAVGLLVVVGGGLAALAVGAIGSMNGDQNENYVGEPVTAGDAPTVGVDVLVSDDERVAFEVGADWVDAAEFIDVSAFEVKGNDDVETVGVYYTADPLSSAEAPSLVIVMAGSPTRELGSSAVEATHKGFLKGMTSGASEAEMDTTFADAAPVTTALGLDGLVTVARVNVQGVDVRLEGYTFVRSDRYVAVMVTNYSGKEDAAASSLVLDTLRIDE